jgi:hypothetical protein
MPAIGAPSAGTEGIGPTIAAGMPAPPGAGADAARQQLEQVIQLVRGIGAQVKQIADLAPMAGDEVTQITELLKAIVVKSAQASPMQTASGMAVPGGSMGGGQ